MNSFPTISINSIQNVFDSLRELYSGDKSKIVGAASRATFGESNAINSTTQPIDSQLDLIRARLSRTADNYGLKLLAGIIEELFDDLIINGAIGVSNNDFLDRAKFKIQDNGLIKYNSDKAWTWTWILTVDDNQQEVSLGLRRKDQPSPEIVPVYILEYVQEAFIAYKGGRAAAALSLMTIALEGTLRDGLQSKGINYTPGAPKEDVYAIEDMHVHPAPNGYFVTFPSAKPLDHSHYLSAAGDPAFREVRIKRVKRNSFFTLEIRDCSDLLDYWSASGIVRQGVRQVSGLGAAIDIGRNQENIIQPIDLPPDLDQVIQTVRNNLIHLSGTAMNTIVQEPAVTLGDFLKNKNRVFDAICTLTDTINVIYRKLSNGTL